MSIKTKVALLLLLSVLLTSCNNTPLDDTTLPKNEEQTQKTYVDYSRDILMTDSPTRLIYLSGYHINYYNKLDGELYPFCFDPLCSHSSSDCLSMKFIMIDNDHMIQYSEFDNRFYILRGMKLYSFSFDGSDIKLEYEFGEDGDMSEMRYSPLNLGNLTIYGHYAYMRLKDEETGRRKLMRYHLSDKVMETLYYESNKGELIDYYIQNDRLYLNLFDEDDGYKMYSSDMNASDLKEDSSINNMIYFDPLYNGKYYFETSVHYEGDVLIYDGITKYDPVSNQREKIYDNASGKSIRLLATTKEKLYFIVCDPISIGYETNRAGTYEKFNYCSKIYCLNIEDGTCNTVFDDIRYSINSIYFLSNEKVFITGTLCLTESGEVTYENMVAIAELDNNGNFINVEEKVLNK